MTLETDTPEVHAILERIRTSVDALNDALGEAETAGLRIDVRLTETPPTRIVAALAAYEEGRRPCDLNSANDG
ncbi:hypothetical protein VQ042_01995 [Aurantimonas sp. A2-1-M11]|uniref:hypothetical protein n=1 Tax=Aurantimonas sp. A2-1-M11 TaxID=3113712 RepID=UPI002F921189